MTSHSRRTTAVVAAGVLTALLATATTASAAPGPGAAEVTQTIKGGALAGGLQFYELPDLTYSHTQQENVGVLLLVIDDSTGSDAGWHITVQSGDFTQGNGGPTIAASNFALYETEGPIYVGGEPVLASDLELVGFEGQDIHEAGGPFTVHTAGSLDQARTVASAEAGYGKGKYAKPVLVALTVPGQSLAGSYTGTVTTTAISGPYAA